MTRSWWRWTTPRYPTGPWIAARDLALLSKGEVWVLHLREREVAVKTGWA